MAEPERNVEEKPDVEPPGAPRAEPSVASPRSAPASSSTTASSTASSPASSPASSTFDDVLRSARLRMGASAVVETVVGSAAGGAAGLIVALVVVGSAPFSIALRVALLGLIGVAAVGAGAVVVVRRLVPLRHDLVVGAAIEASLRRRGAELGDMVRGAVELRDAAQDSARGRSRALCEAHVAATTSRVLDGGGLRSLPGVALERAVPTLVVAAAVGFVVLAWSLAFSASWQARTDKLFTDAGQQRALEERAASLLPLVTDLKLTLRFPAYMQENDEVIPGSSGDITAPRGTEVIVEGRADRALEKASVVLNDAEIAATVSGTNITARFVINDGGTYRFNVDGVKGGSELDPVAHKIIVVADTAPVVSLEEPADDRTVKIGDTIPLAFSAKDDVGVTKFRVVVKRQGSRLDPYVEDLLDVPGGLREAHGGGKLKIDDTGARPGDKLSVYIEALDNDAMSGPKAGRSNTRVLTVYSAIEQHRAVIGRLDDVMHRMVDSLGDELEAPLAPLQAGPSSLDDERRAVEQHRPIAARHQAMQKALDDALVALAQDEVAPASTRRALANMKLKMTRAVEAKIAAVNNIGTAVGKGQAASKAQLASAVYGQKALVERLEQDILYLEDLLNKERIAEARQIADDLKKAEEDLKALVEKFQKTGDPNTRAELLDQIAKMRKEISELMERMAQLQHDIPDEYLNEEAMKTDEMLSAAADIDKLIEDGKLEEALKQLSQMLKQTQKMVDELDKSGEDYGGDEYKELREKVGRFAQQLEALQEGQKANLDGSQSLMDRAKKQAEERLRGKLDKALAEVKKKVEHAEKKLADVNKEALFLNESEDTQFAKARLEDLKRALASKDLDDAASSAEEAEAAARSAERSVADRMRGRFGQKDKQTGDAHADLGDARQDLEDAKKMLQDLAPDPSSLLDKNDRQKLSKDADREEQLRETTEKMQQLMDEINKEAPLFGPDHKKRVDDAKQAMQQAARQMRAQDMRGARSSERQALRQLAELQKDLEDSGNDTGSGGKGERSGKGSGHGGIPMPFPRGGSPGDGSDDNGENGRQASHEEVKIPDGSEFKVPDAFRKDILDAMREGAPSSWAQEVKRYYESLIK